MNLAMLFMERVSMLQDRPDGILTANKRHLERWPRCQRFRRWQAPVSLFDALFRLFPGNHGDQVHVEREMYWWKT